MNKYAKRCLTSLIIREMWVKTTMRYYLILFRTAVIGNKRDKRCWGCGGKGTLVHCWWECKLVEPLWKTVWRFFKKLKIELLIWSSSPLLGKYPVEIKSGSWRASCTSMFYEIVFTVAKIPKQLECPTMDEWIMKMLYIYICNRILFSHEKEGNPATSDMDPRMELEGIMLGELSQTEKDKYCML